MDDFSECPVLLNFTASEDLGTRNILCSNGTFVDFTGVFTSCEEIDDCPVIIIIFL